MRIIPIGLHRISVPSFYCEASGIKPKWSQDRKMLIAAFIFVLSFAAMIQFMALQWRAGLVRVATTAYAGGASANVEAAYNLFKDRGFSDVAAFQRLCPTMGSATPKLH